MIHIVPAQGTHLEEVKTLFQDYQRELAVDLGFQDFNQELETLPGVYKEPRGSMLLAMDQDNIVGCIALKPLSKTVCEMKRLYVRPEYRKQGIGKQLVLKIIAKAKKKGYQLMKLDTLERLHASYHLYQSVGFEETEAYYDNPLDDVVYFQLKLK